MKFQARNPVIEAVRLTGASSLSEIRRLFCPKAISYEETGYGGCSLKILMMQEGQSPIELQRGDYLIVETLGHEQRVMVMPEEEFDRKYEPVPEAT